MVKVEPPGGDDARKWGPPFLDDCISGYFFSLNRNKESIELDLKKDDEKFSSNPKRVIHREDLIPILEQHILKYQSRGSSGSYPKKKCQQELSERSQRYQTTLNYHTCQTIVIS